MGQKGLIYDALVSPWLAFLGLFVMIVVAVEFGRWLGRRNGELPGSGAADGAIFAILGLIIAFSFSGAASRFDERRDLIVQEANAVGTAVLRIDLLPADAQPAMRAAFKAYVDARIAAYGVVQDEAQFRARLGVANRLSAGIWQQAIAAGKRPDAVPAVNMLLLPALNEMIDLTTTRAAAMLMHPPLVVGYMLIGLALVSAMLAGTGFARAPRARLVHELAFAIIMASMIFITLDLEYPRAGVLRVDDFERAVVDLSRLG